MKVVLKTFLSFIECLLITVLFLAGLALIVLALFGITTIIGSVTFVLTVFFVCVIICIHDVHKEKQNV